MLFCGWSEAFGRPTGWYCAGVGPEFGAARICPPKKSPLPEEIQQRWLRLASGMDTSRGNEGLFERIDALVEGGDRTVEFLENELFAEKPSERNRRQARELVALLADADPGIRLRGKEELLNHGDEMWMAMREMNVEEEPASNVKLKVLEAVLVKWMQYRQNSAVYDVLRQIGTPPAQQLLRKLAEELEDVPENKNRKLRAQYTLEELEKLKIRRPD